MAKTITDYLPKQHINIKYHYMLFSIFRLRDIRDSSLFDLILIFYCSHIIGNMIVGGGIFTKPGCAIYLYLIYKIIKQKKRIKQVDDSIISQK